MKSLALILIVMMIWAVGLLAFSARIARSTPAPEPAPAEGIVALTGHSTARIAAGMKLLEDGRGQRMLVSGVNREASREDIRGVAKAPGRIYDCCVDLGFQAVNTVGNARETAQWAREHNFHKLIVVTADYHMPRSILELHGAMPDAQLTPYPVATDELDAKHWWKTMAGAKRMIIEYSKYMVILAREAVLKLGPKDRGAQDHAAAAPARS